MFILFALSVVVVFGILIPACLGPKHFVDATIKGLVPILLVGSILLCWLAFLSQLPKVVG